MDYCFQCGGEDLPFVALVAWIHAACFLKVKSNEKHTSDITVPPFDCRLRLMSHSIDISIACPVLSFSHIEAALLIFVLISWCPWFLKEALNCCMTSARKAALSSNARVTNE